MTIEIEKINKVIEAYFVTNPTITIIPAKKLMPTFIAAGIFKKDFKNGKPIREVLKSLSRTEQLELIPTAYAQGEDESTYWYFVPQNAPRPTTLYKQAAGSIDKKDTKTSRLLSDETYVIDLCDEALQQKAERQKRFAFLLGDLHKDGVSRTQLPVDAYYETLNVVIEYKEPQQTLANTVFDTQNINTVSGVSRSEQRKIYDQRRAVELPLNGIKLIEIAYDIFNCDSQGRIIRNSEQDLQTITTVLENEKIASKI